MNNNDHHPQRVGADNDPGIAAAPLGTDDEAAGTRPAPHIAANANVAPPSRVARPRGGAPLTVILICALVVGAALALFTILGPAA